MGDIRVDQASDVHITTAHGDITIDRADGSVVAKSATGNIRIGDVTTGPIAAHTAAGDVEISVAAGIAAWLDLHTRYGDVRNTLETADAPAPTERTVEVRARSSAGNIVISRP